MPAYDYRCRACGTPFEIRRPVAEQATGAPAPCPLCDSADTERVFTPIAIGRAGPGSSREPMAACGPGCACHPN